MLTLPTSVCRVAEQRKAYRPVTAARLAANGYNDRQRKLPPGSVDPDYFRGYCEAVCDEIDAEAGWFKPAKRNG